MYRLVIFSIISIACVMAMSTTMKPHHGHGTGTHMPHSPRPSHEPSEHEMFKFIYEPLSHKMVVVAGHECYIFSLSDAEKVAVHTDAGIRALELKLLSSLNTASLSTTSKDQLDNKVAHACGGHVTMYYMQTV